MPLITEQISNLINGVSQQPPALRLASQSTTQENGLVTIAEGLKKRPPLEYIAKLSNKTDTEEYNGTAWSVGGASPQAIQEGGGTGTEYAALLIGGFPASPNGVTREYYGETWAHGPCLLYTSDAADE